jgi:hypothetical protein
MHRTTVACADPGTSITIAPFSFAGQIAPGGIVFLDQRNLFRSRVACRSARAESLQDE